MLKTGDLTGNLIMIETEQVASSSPGGVGYISNVHRTLQLLGSFPSSLGTYA